MFKTKQILYYASLVLCAFMLMVPAFINGYPLVNSDTSTYLSSGFIPQTPWDRPITYGLLLRIFSLNGLTMWTVIFLQGYFIAWLISRLAKHFLPSIHTAAYTLLIILALSISTSVSWVASELIADIYTPIAVLSAAVLLCCNETKMNRILLFILYFIAIATHASHLSSFTGSLVLLLLFRKLIFKPFNPIKIRNTILVLLLLTGGTLSIMSVAIAKSKQMFFVGSLLDKQILKPALDDLCVDNDYKLCKYKDNLPEDVNYFLWDKNSPLELEGGWRGTRDEYSEIISKTMSTPKYLFMYIKTSIDYSFQQFATNHIGDGNTPFPENSNVHVTLKKYLPHEADVFVNSLQNTTGIKQHLTIPNNIIAFVLKISFLALLILTFKYRDRYTAGFITLMTVTMTTLLANEAVCATFSLVLGRYGCRVAWLIPLMAILAALQSLAKRGTTTP